MYSNISWGSLLVSLVVLLYLSCDLSVLAEERDLYAILGLTRDCDDADIKKAYRKLSLKYHPDKNVGDEAAQKIFLDVAYANEILSDEDKRQTYDISGEEGLKAESQPQRSGGIFDLFGGQQQQAGKRKGPDYRMEYPVTLEDLFNGGSRIVKISRKVLCKSCRGTGAKGGETKTCPACKGKGQVTTLQQLGPGFNIQMQTPCDKCGGKGKLAKTSCPVCGGSKLQLEEKALEAVIERGMPSGHEIVFGRASEQSPDTIPGDVILTLKQQPHARFNRNGNDLNVDQSISLKEALLGFETKLTHLDAQERKISISQEGVTQPDYVKIIKNEGFPIHNFPSDKGDLHVKMSIRFPKTLTPPQIEAVKALLE